MVYDDAEVLYAEVQRDGLYMLEEAFGHLFRPSSSLKPRVAFNSNTPGDVMAFNATMFPRRDVVRVPLTGTGGSRLKSKVVQASSDGSTGFALVQSGIGFTPSLSRGLFSDCDPVSGTLEIPLNLSSITDVSLSDGNFRRQCSDRELSSSDENSQWPHHQSL